MSSAEFNQLLDAATRRQLTAAEEDQLRVCLAEDPSAKAVWEDQMALSRLLGGLPDAPLSTNFTAQVLQSLERDARKRLSRARWIFRWPGLRRPARPFAIACLVLALGAVGYWQQRTLRRGKMALALAHVARSVETVSQVAPLPPVEMWQDYEPISRLDQTRPQADEELLDVLKELAMK